MVGQNILCHIEPEFGHLCQYGTFFGDFVVENDIKAADTVSSNHDQAVAVVINLTYFTFFNWF